MRYDKQTQHWDINGYGPDGEEWVFSSVESVIDVMIDSFSCLAFNEEISEDYDFRLNRLAKSLERDRDHMAMNYKYSAESFDLVRELCSIKPTYGKGFFPFEWFILSPGNPTG
jgi:hypothetical protein